MIKNILFDLDNTLYSALSPINSGITRRMKEFVVNFLNLPEEECLRQREEGIKKYGSTLNWLRNEKKLKDPESFFSFVHPESETTELIPDTNLKPFLQSLPYNKGILTNSPLEHALRVLDFYGIRDLFSGIYDLRINNFNGKPYPAAYQKALDGLGFAVSETIFIDDSPRYLDGFTKLGGAVLLVDEFSKYRETPYPKVKTIYSIPEILKTL